MNTLFSNPRRDDVLANLPLEQRALPDSQPQPKQLNQSQISNFQSQIPIPPFSPFSPVQSSLLRFRPYQREIFDNHTDGIQIQIRLKSHPNAPLKLWRNSLCSCTLLS